MKSFMPSGHASLLTAGIASTRISCEGVESYRFKINGANEVYIKFGDVTIEASTTDYTCSLPSGGIEVITVPNGVTHMASIAAVASAFAVTPGVGI